MLVQKSFWAAVEWNQECVPEPLSLSGCQVVQYLTYEKVLYIYQADVDAAEL